MSFNPPSIDLDIETAIPRAIAATPAPATAAPIPLSPPRATGAAVPPSQPQPAPGRDSMLAPRESQAVIIDSKRDLLTSQVAASAFTSNADMYLQEGIVLKGTHYGLNLISTSGVVIIAKDCVLLPSSTRATKIVAKRIAVMGQAALSRLQADETLLIVQGSRVLVENIVYGRTLVVADESETIVTGGTRKLLDRERRAEQVYNATAREVQGALSFDDAVQQHNARIEAELGEEMMTADEAAEAADLMARQTPGNSLRVVA